MTKIKCPVCNDQFTSLEGLYAHVEDEHDDEIPDGFTSSRYVYYLRTGKSNGQCVVCKKSTDWNNVTEKYFRFCNNPKCKNQYREQFKKRMIGKYGKTSLLNDPEQQKKMLANRSISGTYVWSDGTKKTYTGSYELDCLKFLDAFMNFDSADVMTPSPHTYYYMYKGEKKFYFPDIYIASLDLEIEVKESDNKHGHMVIDREKERLKDVVMANQPHRRYIKIVDKKYDNFMEFLIEEKKKFIANKNTVIPVKESLNSIINEFDSVMERFSSCHDLSLENYIVDNDDLYLNFNKWKKNSKNNVLFITGLSGSGKSTLASEYAQKYKADKFEIDWIEHPKYAENNKFIQTALSKFPDFNHYSQYPDTFTSGDFISMRNIVFQWVISEMEKQTNKLFIVEGLQLFTSIDNKEYFKNKPLIVKGTSFSTSLQRRIDRAVNNTDGRGQESLLSALFHELTHGINYSHHEKKLQSFKSLVNENFQYELSCLDESLEDEDEILEESSGEKYPVFIMLTHSGTMMSNIIKTATNAEYSHASISFDSSMRDMYSFGRKSDSNPFIGRFKKEDIRSPFFTNKNVPFSLYAVFVSKPELSKMKKRLDFFIRNESRFRYNFVGLLKTYVGITDRAEYKYFCSSFVADVLNSGKKLTNQHHSLIKPMDLTKLSFVQFIISGHLVQYSKEKVDDIISQLKYK